jgi:imidazole glycerol-phosphate synthase subunit HisF
MLKKRILPCLDIRDGRTVKGVNFVGLRDAGDPVALARSYAAQGADELVLLDITATVENRGTLLRIVEQVAEQIDIPFTVGGGIRELADAAALLRVGADKISVNSAAVRDPQLIARLADKYGSQCVVVAVDTGLVDGEWHVFTHGGRQATPIRTLDWVVEAARLGAGELLLTSMENDGTKAGFAVALTRLVGQAAAIPVIGPARCSTSPRCLPPERRMPPSQPAFSTLARCPSPTSNASFTPNTSRSDGIRF